MAYSVTLYFSHEKMKKIIEKFDDKGDPENAFENFKIALKEKAEELLEEK